MNVIDILIVVDTLGASTSENLQNNVYLIDTNKYIGSLGEGQGELHSVCHDGQIVKWHVTPIDSSADVEITQFTGQIITSNVCNPVKQGVEGDIYWEGRVETQGATGTFQYSCILTIDGKAMAFDPFLEVK